MDICIASLEKEQDEKVEKDAAEKVDKYINPILVCKEIEAQAADNAIFVADGGDFVGTAAYVLRPRGPLSWMDPGAFGTLGVGAGFAIGAKLSKPESEVWIIYGDGACGFSIAELDTMVRMKIPVIAVVGNDAAWMQIYRSTKETLNSEVACLLAYTDYQEVAKGFGAEGLIARSAEELPGVIKQAKELAKQGKPVLINTLIGRTDFRKGSMSM
jgi:thiamine pyrophosphate-dependent acetolactate synthase large subunit-like protein